MNGTKRMEYNFKRLLCSATVPLNLYTRVPVCACSCTSSVLKLQNLECICTVAHNFCICTDTSEYAGNACHKLCLVCYITFVLYRYSKYSCRQRNASIYQFISFFILCDWICKKESYMHNYKYLEIQF